MMCKAFRMVLYVVVFFFLLCVPAFSADLININTATAQELVSLPGIGPVIAEKIIEHRKEHPFATIESIMGVKGIGAAKFDAIKALITVGEPEAPKEPKKEPKKE